MSSEAFMSQAIALAVENVRRGGGPFAAVVVKDGTVVATGVNSVTSSNDPTAHAEMVAIRAACRALNSFQLEGCDLYASSEPCPMCLGAIYWARPARVYFAATCEQAAAAGFDDSLIYHELTMPRAERLIPAIHVEREDSLEPFREWVENPRKVPY